MNKELYAKLKEELKEAVRSKNIKKIEELKQMLNIPQEQEAYFAQGLTGYPSIDKIWLKNYKDGAENLANNIPINKTVWDVMENKLLEYYDVPALEYFGKIFSKQEFIDLCYTWARTFRAMGVEENEIVPIYGPFVPDICAMFFALNMIGACPYFLKLAMSKEALEEETKEAKIAVVFDGMWPNVREEFSKDKFKKVIVASVTANMPSPKKEIVSFINNIQAKKNKTQIPDEKKYIWIDKACEIADYYTGQVKVPFVKNRNAVITSSSGTTGGLVKGVIATNESIISQVYSTTYSDIPYKKGYRTLNHFPPTASTSLNSLFLVTLMNGATVIIDPRVSEKDFYNQLVKLKPNICINTSSMWEAFFNRITQEMKRGKKFDFSYAKGWMVGGEGTNNKSFKNWNDIMTSCNASGIYGGYGLSETFSGISIDRVDVEHNYSKSIATVGAIQAGMIAGVFDKNGNELSYNQRGELRVKAKSQMKGYYNKPELTEKSLVDGWVKTGDIVQIDDNGFLYVWGRINDSIKLQDENELYLFDVENKIRENNFIHDVVVLPMPTEENNNNLVAHIVWDYNVLEDEKQHHIETLNEKLKQFLPNEVEVSAYSVHDIMLPYSPTTLKKDKNKMSKQTSGYVQVKNGRLYNVEFILNQNGRYIQKCDIISDNKVKTLTRK